ncbi:MAG: OmpA family protein [Bacteroidota bacterium]
MLGKQQTEQAIAEMKYALKEWPTLADAYSQLGAWYFKARRYDEAIAIFDQAARNLKNGERDFALPKARSLVLSSRLTEAQLIIAKYITGKPRDPWTALKQQADFVANAMAHPVTFSVYNMGCNINTLDAEIYPYISSDGQTLYFTRRVNGVDEDFFMATADTSCDEKWSIAENLGRPPNTPNQESAQMISADGHYLFFTRCENRNVNGWESGGCDLYMAYRKSPDSAWSIPESFGPTINSAYFEGMPCLSPDNRELYFVSDRPGGYGGLDIWVSKFEDGLWQVPQNLGPQVNTKGNETAPFLHIDNHSLFFASDGHGGMGGSDLFYTTKITDTEWTTPKNLGYPINSMADESSISVTVDGKTAYFSSDRRYTVGNFDLYETTLPLSFHPLPVAVIKGYVYDSISKEPLNYASIYVNDEATGLPIYHFQSNRGDGSFMITLPQGKKYALLTDRIGYLETNDTLSLLSNTDKSVTIEHNLRLLSQEYIKPISDTMVLVLHFPVNSSSLSDSDKLVIKNAMTPFLGNKDMTVYINGFADTTGTPIINEQLSFNRAKLVATEVAVLGVNNDLIKYQGWGEANPIATNSTEEGRSKNRRVEIIIRH